MLYQDSIKFHVCNLYSHKLCYVIHDKHLLDNWTTLCNYYMACSLAMVPCSTSTMQN